MNAFTLMESGAEMFRARLLCEPGCKTLPMPAIGQSDAAAALDLQWDNVLLRSRTFRRAHVETFDVPGRLSVLHVCVFPHLADPSPIFGFDMVAGPARVTGIFLDLSPVVAQVPSLRLSDVVGASRLGAFAAPRGLPEWGDIFSDDMLAVRPADLDEVSAAIRLAHEALDGLLTAPRSSVDAMSHEVAAGQGRYLSGQRRNEHTVRMLAGFVGMPFARRFVDEVLFPMDGLSFAGQPSPTRSSSEAPAPS